MLFCHSMSITDVDGHYNTTVHKNNTIALNFAKSIVAMRHHHDTRTILYELYSNIALITAKLNCWFYKTTICQKGS